MKKCIAIVLAAGQGRRMGTTIQKQFLEIQEKPVLYYSLRAFEDFELIDEIILVTGCDMVDYCKKEIVERFGLSKVSKIISGGAERYHSVYNGLCAITDEGYVFIHDGARPFINASILKRVYDEVQIHRACVVGMPVKDTIKIVDTQQFAASTPPRDTLWLVQTPQVFEIALIKEAFEKLMSLDQIQVTDDAMVVEQMTGIKVKLVEGTYENIKITTPEDLLIAESFLKKGQ